MISVSGISSGAEMATQMHVAFSALFVGVGIVGGSKNNIAVVCLSVVVMRPLASVCLSLCLTGGAVIVESLDYRNARRSRRGACCCW